MTMIIWAGLALPNATQTFQSDFALCVVGNCIVDCGVRDAVVARHPEADQVGNAQWCMLPALVNSHDHGRGLGALQLGAPDDLLEIWLPGLFSQPYTNPYLIACYEAALLLRSGVGTTAHSHNPRSWSDLWDESTATLAGYTQAGLRVAYHPPLVDQNPLVYTGRERFLAGLPSTLLEAAQRFLQPIPLTQSAYFDLCQQLFQRYHDGEQHTVHIQVSPAGGQWCSDELILACVAFAQRQQTRVQMHLLETQYQRRYAHQRWGKSFPRHLAEIGALGPWLTLAHGVWLDEEDLPLLAEHGVGVAHNPSSNLRLRSGVAPVPALLQAGVSVGVGLDGQALDDDQDYLRELRLAWTLANRPGATARPVTAAEIWQMGTTQGAALTLGQSAPLGRLEVGALADLILVDWAAVQGAWSSPLTPPADLLLRRATRQQVRQVMVNGQWVVRDGQATRIDEGEVAGQLCATLNQLDSQQLAHNTQAAQALAPYIRRFYAAWDEGE
jgi:cytosine/adenosine deaminase-related metal-dependent hydrolase